MENRLSVLSVALIASVLLQDGYSFPVESNQPKDPYYGTKQDLAPGYGGDWNSGWPGGGVPPKGVDNTGWAPDYGRRRDTPGQGNTWPGGFLSAVGEVIPNVDTNKGDWNPKQWSPKGWDLKDLSPQKWVPKDMDLKGFSLGELSPKDLNLKGLSPEGLVPKDFDLKGLSLEWLVPKDFDLKGLSPEGLVPKDLDLKRLSPKELVPKDLDLTGLSPKGWQPKNWDQNAPRSGQPLDAFKKLPGLSTFGQTMEKGTESLFGFFH